MRVVYVGPFAQPWTTESAVARELQRMGHEVIPVPSLTSTMNVLEDLASDCDLLLLQGNQLERDPAVAMFRRLERRGVKTASYHLDIFRGLARAPRIDLEAMWRTQFVFTADGDPESAQWFASHDVEHYWLPAAVESTECVEGTWRADFEHDVCFVGSRNYHAEWPWRRQLIALLQRQYSGRLRLVSGDAIRGRELNDLYRSAKIIVGDSLCLPGHRNYWSDRYYETVGRGGFLVAPAVPGIDAHFTDGMHLRLYEPGDGEQLVELIDFYLEDRIAVTRDMAAHGQAHVREHHTYKHRAEELLSVVGLSD